MDEKLKGYRDFIMQHGAFSWSELVTTDVPGAVDFYTKLFGWTTQELQMEGMSYTLIKVGESEVGGIMAVPPEAQGMPPAWGVYVTVDDVDATAKTAEKLGGKIIVPPTDIPEVGRFCVIQDPQGAYIAAITYVPMQE
jgi:predicted enzyme related to lactoylglutathione lyase